MAKPEVCALIYYRRRQAGDHAHLDAREVTS